MRVEGIMPETAPPKRWLSIVGIGEDGVEGLSPVARGLIGAAEIVLRQSLDLTKIRPLEKATWAGAIALPIMRAKSNENSLPDRNGRECILTSRRTSLSIVLSAVWGFSGEILAMAFYEFNRQLLRRNM